MLQLMHGGDGAQRENWRLLWMEAYLNQLRARNGKCFGNLNVLRNVGVVNVTYLIRWCANFLYFKLKKYLQNNRRRKIGIIKKT